MTTKQVDLPKGKTYPWGEPRALKKEERNAFKKLGADALIYWYVGAQHEGAGSALFRKDGKWHLHNLGHNSTYGPTDDLKLKGPGESLRALKARCSEEYLSEVKNLFAEARLTPEPPSHEMA